LRLVFHLAEIEDLADGRIDISGDLDEVQACVDGPRDRIPCGNDAELVSILIDKANLCRLNILVDARAITDRRRCKGSLGYRIILVVKDEFGDFPLPRRAFIHPASPLQL
jgi:hypothetical protein